MSRSMHEPVCNSTTSKSWCADCCGPGCPHQLRKLTPHEANLFARHSTKTKGQAMTSSIIQRASAAGALMLIFTIGSGSAFAAYSWTEILIPSIGPMGAAFGPNDKGQVAVQSADFSKTGIYRGGIYTRLPTPPAGYNTLAAYGIN